MWGDGTLDGGLTVDDECLEVDPPDHLSFDLPLEPRLRGGSGLAGLEGRAGACGEKYLGLDGRRPFPLLRLPHLNPSQGAPGERRGGRPAWGPPSRSSTPRALFPRALSTRGVFPRALSTRVPALRVGAGVRQRLRGLGISFPQLVRHRHALRTLAEGTQPRPAFPKLEKEGHSPDTT